MRKIKRKYIFFISIFLLIISSTVAYLYSTDIFTNIFVAASYKVTVTETFESPDNWKPGDTTPKTATIKNEGTVPIKVRVKLEEEWKDSNNQDLPLTHNDENIAIINFSNEDDYIYKDGYYYYDLPVNPGETTSSIIESVTFNPNYSGTITCVENDDSTHTCSSSYEGYEGGTYKLTLSIEGVQEDYYVQAWGLPGVVERKYLYDVLKNEAESGGLARKYTGEHHDSFSEEPSKDIYHWYAENDSEGTVVTNKNNVIFGNHCWQMIRTTDTGGVKMIYNGEVVDNQCLNTRGTHVGYASITTQTLSGNYWYGTDYTYDFTTKKFKVSGTTEQTIWNDSTSANLIGKYTCKLGTISGTCSTLYLIESYNTTTSAYVIPLNSNSNYSQFGRLQFNLNDDSPTYVGYKYGDVYTSSYISPHPSQSFSTRYDILQASSLATSYWYADSVDYGSLVAGKYSLVDAYKVSSTSDYQNLVGKYTFKSTSQSYTNRTVYYIIGVNNTTMYYAQLENGKSLSNYNIIIGDSITDNGDDTYTINNSTSVSLSNWFMNYANYKDKYTCNIDNEICENPRYIISSNSMNYSYISTNEKIMIGKSRSGTTLVDTLLLQKYDFVINRNLYSDYKYTCNTVSDVCTEASLRMIRSISLSGYTYVPNYYSSSSVTWDGSNYILNNPIEIENFENYIYDNHYFCLTPGEKTCTEVAYIHSYPDLVYYVTLKNGVSKIDKVLEGMFTKNLTNSTIKSGIDAWYKHYMLDYYDNYIEDTIFCNDRRIIEIGGWDDDGNIEEDLLFKNSDKNSDLSCTNDTDKFSISNTFALLDYKVGLMSIPEMMILNQVKIKAGNNVGNAYRISSPYKYDVRNGAYGSGVGIDGSVLGGYLSIISAVNGVRPAISLKPGIEYESGDGSMANPYIVKMD